MARLCIIDHRRSFFFFTLSKNEPLTSGTPFNRAIWRETINIDQLPSISHRLLLCCNTIDLDVPILKYSLMKWKRWHLRWILFRVPMFKCFLHRHRRHNWRHTGSCYRSAMYQSRLAPDPPGSEDAPMIVPVSSVKAVRRAAWWIKRPHHLTHETVVVCTLRDHFKLSWSWSQLRKICS